MATVTLAHSVAPGLQSLAKMRVKVSAATIFRGELDLIGMIVQSDDTAIVGTEIVRTIVLETTTDGDAMWPTAAALLYPTKNLYKASLEKLIPARVIASEPVAVV